jgi:hypothetical protein
MQIRYSFTAQFVRGGAIFANKAHEIEATNISEITEELAAEYRSYVVSTVFQCAAALESEIAEITQHGPGHQLGSNGLNVPAHNFLKPLADVIDGESTLRRYELVLHLLQLPALERGTDTYRTASLLIKLRNELIHYKSRWDSEIDRAKLFSSLRQLKLDKPSFIQTNTTFFPHQCLSASLASWSVITTISFITEFYSLLGIVSPLKPYLERLVVPAPRMIGLVETYQDPTT